jgi:hypothetical protein
VWRAEFSVFGRAPSSNRAPRERGFSQRCGLLRERALVRPRVITHHAPVDRHLLGAIQLSAMVNVSGVVCVLLATAAGLGAQTVSLQEGALRDWTSQRDMLIKIAAAMPEETGRQTADVSGRLLVSRY